jgi:hypothetical protein
MAAPNINICGFECGNNQETPVTENGAAASFQTTTKRTGSYALRINTTGDGNTFSRAELWGRDSAGQLADMNQATAYYRFYFRYATKPASGDEILFAAVASGGTIKFELRLKSDGTLAAYDSVPTLQDTGATVLASGTWYRIEVKVETGASAAFEVKLAEGDGTASVELSGTGNLTTGNNGFGAFGKVTNRNTQEVDFYYDDLAIGSTDYIGQGQCHIAVPSGNGTYTNATIGAGAGALWQQVDEVPHDSDTTYLLTTGTDGQAYTALFDAAAVLPAVQSVNAVKAVYACQRDGANTLDRLRFRSGSTDSDGADIIFGAGYTLIRADRIFTTDPNTSSAWLAANMSALEAGVIERDTNLCRITAIYLMVDVTLPVTQEVNMGSAINFVGSLPLDFGKNFREGKLNG